jgi:hypothetical protein
MSQHRQALAARWNRTPKWKQEAGWARRKPHAELTTSPEADGQAAVARQLAALEAERQRQAARLPQVRPEPLELDTGHGTG